MNPNMGINEPIREFNWRMIDCSHIFCLKSIFVMQLNIWKNLTCDSKLADKYPYLLWMLPVWSTWRKQTSRKIKPLYDSPVLNVRLFRESITTSKPKPVHQTYIMLVTVSILVFNIEIRTYYFAIKCNSLQVFHDEQSAYWDCKSSKFLL